MLTEKLGVEYSRSSVQYSYPKDFARKVIGWGKKYLKNPYIDPEDDSYGLENDIHTTVFYGITSADPRKSKKLIEQFPTFQVTLGKLAKFTSDKYDVLKIDVEGKELHKLHYAIEKHIDNKNDYPDYKPHCTIGYVEPGTADQFIDAIPFEGMKFKIKAVIFSSKDGRKYRIPLK